MSVDEILSTWNKTECVRFAVWCARRVVHLNLDPRVNGAIAAIDAWLKDPSDANVEAVYPAIEGAIESALEACAFKDKIDAIYGAAANAAYAAANAAYVIHANDFAQAAVCACDSAVRCCPAEGLSSEDLLQIYLGDVLMREVVDG